MVSRLLLLLSLLPSLAFLPACTQERENIFDRVVHLEPEVITEIPDVPRLEERLGIEGRRVSVGNAELWVEEEGEGIPLVLINGGPGGTHHMFHPWFHNASEFARVIYYDQRGCGLSDYEPGPDGYSVEQAVEDLEALRQVLGIDRFVLAGFSYGGFLAQFYTTHYPENVAGLILVGASPQITADLGRSRQQEFISDEERERIREFGSQLRDMREDRGWTPAEFLALVVYNNHLNGDWKRQNFYKPSPERMAQIALYEWVQDGPFNSVMGQSQSRVDLTGAFDANPIPTLIMEGEWDLTWGPEKKAAIAANHPNARLVTFENAAHSIFDEDTEGFFSTLKSFLEGLKPVDPGALATFKGELEAWRTAWMASPRYHLAVVDWGLGASQDIAAAFKPGWEEEPQSTFEFLRLGFALYDVERYEDALSVFSYFRDEALQDGEQETVALASIWKGHMLDLLGRRAEAVGVYQEVADMGLEDRWSHDQYGMNYLVSAYAAERLETPFQRIENRQR